MPRFHIKRARLEVRILIPQAAKANEAQGITEGVNGEKLEARLILNDVSKTGMGFYSVKPLSPGQRIKISLSAPIPLELEGEVRWCEKLFATGRVLSAMQYDYRLGVRFAFKSKDQEECLSRLCAEIQK